MWDISVSLIIFPIVLQMIGANEDESAEKSAWQQISDESVKKYLSKVKESKSQGSDSIHLKLIKEMGVSISKPVYNFLHSFAND
jgi:predicted DNA binding CopG/RHH family protein